MRILCAISLVLALVPQLPGQTQELAKAADGKVETIILIRHGEKPWNGLGQITCKGLNRALALPAVLVSKFGKADQVYAPDPTGKAHDPGGTFDYVRPLATIEPTAVALGLPVNCDYRYDQIKDLETELLKPHHAGQVIFVAWEHHYLNQMVKDLLQQKGGDPKQVPDWPGGEYDRIYILRIPAGTESATFSQDQENLNNVSDQCGEAAKR
jgi:broad specificity phosphatase PhoE